MTAVAGAALSRNADVIADRTGLSGSWVGLMLIATVTSLPELITGASAIVLLRAGDLAVGNILGACVVNLVVLAVLDLLLRGESVYRRAGLGHVLSAGFGIVMLSLTALAIVMPRIDGATLPGLSAVFAPAILGLYLLAVRSVFTFERAQLARSAHEQAERYPDRTLRAAVTRYALAAVAVVAAGVWLPFVAQDLAEAMGWSGGFVGTLLVAAVTTAPELVVTVAAIRLGAVDMAVANLLGSNLFNMVVLALDTVLYRPATLLAEVSAVHAVSALSAVIMSGIVIVGLVFRPTRRLRGAAGWIGLALLATYLMNAYAVFLWGHARAAQAAG